jgi:beta-glucosidase-like glycosyl hydrolase
VTIELIGFSVPTKEVVMDDSYRAYLDPSMPIGQRVTDLLSRMTLEEKAAQTASPFGSAVDTRVPPPTGWGSATAAISSLGLPPREAAAEANELQRKHVEGTRLGIPVLLAEEALLGFKVRGATTFPDAIAHAATWHPELVERMASEIGSQMAALGARLALSPLADVQRDPRWGRVGETYGEDPYLVGIMASAFVRGLQNAREDVPIAATLKHFVGYSASDGGRNTEPANVGPRALREVYGLPFEMAVAAGARSVMPSYNDLDGVPVTGSSELLAGLLREEYGFDGLVISDLAAVGQLQTKHGVAGSPEEAFALAFAAGVDLDLDNRVSSERIVDAVRSGVLREADLDRAVASVLRTKFRLGLFERPYADVAQVPETLDSPEARDLARTVAEQSIVLLRNEIVGDGPLLPLPHIAQRIAVIGPNADRPLGQLGHYSYQVLDSMTTRFRLAADPQSRSADVAELAGTGPDDVALRVESVPIVTFLDGIRQRAPEGSTVRYERGSSIATDDRSGIPAAVAVAAESDVAIVVVGDQAGINGLGTVGEGLDSATCELPGLQRELIEAVLATGTPTIVVLSHARPYVLGWLTERAPAVLTAWFGGEEAGSAVARVLFGDVNPAGRLPVAMLESVGAAPAPYWRSSQPDSYVDASVRAVFPFGHGLSFTTFEYRGLDIESSQVPTDGTIRLAVTVANVGSRAGDEVVQVYGRDVVARTARRGRVLLAFSRIALEAGEERRMVFEVPADRFALWDPREGWVVEPGSIKLFAGGSSAATPLRADAMLVGTERRIGRGRRLLSTVVVDGGPFEFAESPAPAPDAAQPPIKPLTAESTVGEWLEHPVGRGLLLAALGGIDEETLTPALGATLSQMVMYSQGALPEELPGHLLAQAAEAQA